MADQGKEATIRRTFMLIHELFNEAVENNYVMKNPARRIVLPSWKRIREIEPLTEAQVRALFENTEVRDRLMWRIRLLTGVRIGELLALRKSDLSPIDLCGSPDRSRPSTTKNKKPGNAPIPDSLRSKREDQCYWDDVLAVQPVIRDFLKAGCAALAFQMRARCGAI